MTRITFENGSYRWTAEKIGADALASWRCTEYTNVGLETESVANTYWQARRVMPSEIIRIAYEMFFT